MSHERIRHRAGPYVIVRYHQTRGYGIVDERTGRPAYTEPSPTTGRPIRATLPTLSAALTVAADLARHRR